MRHARPERLQALAGLLDSLRALPGLTERQTGIFYVKSRAYLHFHEDSSGLYADIRLGDADFTRLPVASVDDQQRLLSLALADRLG